MEKLFYFMADGSPCKREDGYRYVISAYDKRDAAYQVSRLVNPALVSLFVPAPVANSQANRKAALKRLHEAKKAQEASAVKREIKARIEKRILSKLPADCIVRVVKG